MRVATYARQIGRVLLVGVAQLGVATGQPLRLRTSDGEITVKNVSGKRMSRCTDPAMVCASAIVNASMSFAHGIATKSEFDRM